MMSSEKNYGLYFDLHFKLPMYLSSYITLFVDYLDKRNPSPIQTVLPDYRQASQCTVRH